ncbi:lysine-2,3-aminomutase-like protein [Acetobacteraceae bacterium]|nr:lysine-2,3-aminomutase-like protein [Acetobacteraceae bacterium]
MTDSSSKTTLRHFSQLIAEKLLPDVQPAPQWHETLSKKYAIAVPKTFAEIIEHSDDPIARQVLPDERELHTQSYEVEDPTADEAFSPIAGIIHRYPHRILLKPLLICPLYCRFCFRREFVGQTGKAHQSGLLSQEHLEAALDWIENHSEINEVILSGGDPLLLSPRRLRFILQRLEKIPHVKTLRIHSRVPVAAPELITAELLKALETEKPLWIAIHANHAKEFSPKARKAIRDLRKQGVLLLSQSVLLKDVNDNVEALADLFEGFLEMGVKPYYLHHLDPAPGTAHFRVEISDGLALLRQLRGRLSGLAFPAYTAERPQGGGKIPLGPAYELKELKK